MSTIVNVFLSIYKDLTTTLYQLKPEEIIDLHLSTFKTPIFKCS